MSKTVYCRLAKEGDQSDILNINQKGNPHPWREKHLLEALSKDQIFLSLLDEQPVGFAVWQSVCDEAELHLIVTHPDYLRHGFADALLSHSIKALQNKGLCQFFLEVRENNHPARRLYEKMGFSDMARRRDYYQNPNEDAIIMEKTC